MIVLFPIHVLCPMCPPAAAGSSGCCTGFGRQGHLGETGEDGTAAGQPPGEQGGCSHLRINFPPFTHLNSKCDYSLLYIPVLRLLTLLLWSSPPCAGCGDGLPEDQEL